MSWTKAARNTIDKTLFIEFETPFISLELCSSFKFN